MEVHITTGSQESSQRVQDFCTCPDNSGPAY